MQTCIRCSAEKPLSEFYVDRAKHNGLRSACKECDKEKGALRRKNHPEKVKREVQNSKYIKKYGLTSDDVERMRQEQQNCCSICKHQLKDGIFTCVDHDHATGKVRALLCRGCNLVLGNAQDSEEVLLSAVEYLRKHRFVTN
jgi:hypothetical protein